MDKLLYLNKNKINAIELKSYYKSKNTCIFTVNHFIELNLFKNLEINLMKDVFICMISLEEIKQLIEQYHLIVNSILHSTA